MKKRYIYIYIYMCVCLISPPLYSLNHKCCLSPR
ncbi:unnamed protein product [Phytomonas sp. Hart1]|nr:unnamed protein product [Phytomonas sp. Hart1]|eukprot:CCW71949.1 unnamed protein product [Phytomonas sp. isolate Hart1]